MKFTGFEWDDGNWPKCGKHGVTREEIEQFFSSAKVAPRSKTFCARFMHHKEVLRYEEGSNP